MTTILTLTDETRPLFVEIGHHIARCLWETLGQKDPNYETEMWDQAESVYEHGTSILTELGILNEIGQSLYTFRVTPPDVRDHLGDLEPRTDYTFDQIIGNFLRFTSDYRGEISNEPDPFQVPGYLEQAMWAFVALGYATREPDGFQWTDKIRPIMVAEYLWSAEENKSYVTIDREKSQKLADRMWDTLPLWRRHCLARWIVGKSMIDIHVYLGRRWTGEGFRLRARDISKPENRIDMPSNFIPAVKILADRLIEVRKHHPF